MKRVLIVGNSHAGAIKLGWDMLAAQAAERVEVHFFVAPSPIFRRLGAVGSVFGELPGGDLVDEERAFLIRINGDTAVELEAFDEILLVGMFWAGTNEVLPILNSFTVDGLYEISRPQRLTQQAFRDMLLGAFRAAAFDPVWTSLRRPKLTLLLRPMPIELVRSLRVDQIVRKNRWASAKVEYDRMRPVLEIQKRMAHDFYSEHGIALMHQPEDTILPSGLTKDKYCRDRVESLTKPGSKIDIGHMNADFGRFCMTEYLDRIAPTAGSDAQIG